jgi:hypothetical protein
VDALNVRIAELNEQVNEVPLLQASLQKAVKEANDADSKLQAAVNENEQIQEQVCPSIPVVDSTRYKCFLFVLAVSPPTLVLTSTAPLIPCSVEHPFIGLPIAFCCHIAIPLSECLAN